jgi:glycosyltransferase involved in cell wall biosynthesis
MRHLINQKPFISVILPVHNAEKYLVEALESLRYQTYPHFEVIAIDDASTDSSYQILKNYAKIDSRFKIFHNKINLKIANTLNFGLTKAKGYLIARMDADDIALPNRFQKQVNFLTKHPGVVVVGGQCLTIDENSHITGKKLFPVNHLAIFELMYTANPLQHPSIMINRDLLPSDFTWYNPHLTPAEDLDLYFRLGKFGLFANLKSTILMYRQHGDSETFRNPKYTFSITQKVRQLAISKYGYQPSIKSKVLASIQSLVLSVIPASLVFPLYTFIRGTKIKEKLEDLNLRLANS